MAEFRMPSLGADMEAGTLVEWKVKAGDAVKRGDIVAVVDTNKGAIDIEIWESGTVAEIRVEVGAKVPVGTVLAVVSGVGAPDAAAAAGGAAPPVTPAPAVSPVPPTAAPARVSEPVPALAPAPPPPGARARASPAARARARELEVDLATVRGTGPGGAVTLADVDAAARVPRPPPAAPAAGEVPAERGAAPFRQAIAAAMSRSKREIPHYYLGTEIELSRALAWLARENEKRPVTERLLPVVLLLKAVARAVREVPEVNGYYVDGAFRPSGAVHLGVAISMRQGGLVAPALHDVEGKALGQLMSELNDLVARARRGGLRSSELTDATLTVTSLGDLGVGTVYGVIYPPQVGLVGFGRVQERAWVESGRLEVRPVVSATLSGDHRVSDGIRGARYLAALDRLLQAPEDL